MKNVPAINIFTLTSEIKAYQVRTIEACLEIGQRLFVIKESKAYKAYASHTHTFEDYLKEIGIGRRTAYNLVDMSQIFGEILIANPPLMQTDPTRLIKLLPYLREADPAVKEEFLISAKELPTIEALENNLRSRFGGTPTDACEHTETIMIEHCKNCGKRFPV